MPTSAVCAICGEKSGQVYLKSTNGTGDFDLDFRRHGMIRSTINECVSRCPHCGYCAPHIGRRMKTTKEIATKLGETYKYLNQGYTVDEISNLIGVPKRTLRSWFKV